MSARFTRGLGERAAHLRRTADAWEAGEDDGREGLRVAAHRLKGIAGSCGHPDLGESAARLEARAKAGERPAAVAEARRLADEADRRCLEAVERDPVPWVVLLQPSAELRSLADRALARLDDLDATVVADLPALATTLESRRTCQSVMVPADLPADVVAAALTRACEAGVTAAVLAAKGEAVGGSGARVHRVPLAPGPAGLVAAARDALRLLQSSLVSSRSSSS